MNQMVRPAQFERSTPVEAITGTIERVTFHNEENGFCVLKVQARGERYLASGQMRGIGPAMAKRLVATFGESTFEIIEAAPERLTEVSGIGPWRASRIVAGWAEQKAVREIMIFLHAHGVGTARAVRIFKTYGHEANKVMTEDPYRLARDVRGIGFRTADAIAAKLGVEKTSPQRLRAGVSFALQTATDEGHCGLPIDQLTGRSGCSKWKLH